MRFPVFSPRLPVRRETGAFQPALQRLCFRTFDTCVDASVGIWMGRRGDGRPVVIVEILQYSRAPVVRHPRVCRPTLGGRL